MCENFTCNFCARPVHEPQGEYYKGNYQVGKCLNGACKYLKDSMKEDVVTQSLKQKS